MKKTLVNIMLMSLFPLSVKAGVQDFLLDPFGLCKIESKKVDLDANFSFSYSTYAHFKKNDTRGAMLILPPTGGKNVLDKGYAAMFCKAGYKVYILEDWTGLLAYDLDLKMHQLYQNRAQKAISAVIDQISEKKISVLGASAGAINFSVTMGIPEVIKRIDAFLGITSGGSLCKVISNAGEQALKKVREERMEKFKIASVSEYENKICENLNWDIAKEKPKHLKLGFITALKDQTVLTRFQDEQVRRTPPDFLLKINSDHRGSIIRAFLWHRWKIKKFFD